MPEAAVLDDVAPRRLSPRQAEAVARLVDAAVDEVAAEGPNGFSVRGAARRCGIAPATAYTYFSSKEHLLSEAMWRRIRHLPEVDSGDGHVATVDRVVGTLQMLGTFLADTPELSAACTIALLAPSPDVKRLRVRIGAEIHRRLSAALGDRAEPAVLVTLEFAYFGAMISAGMGHITFEELAGQLSDVARLVVEAAP